jgi:ABC-type multidrug transport system fused ATPase/permease subunit
MEGDLTGRHTVDFSLGDRNSLKNAERVFFYEIGKSAFFDERPNLSVGASMRMDMALVFMAVLLVLMFLLVSVAVFMMFVAAIAILTVRMLVAVVVMAFLMTMILLLVFILIVGVRCPLMDAELYALDSLAQLSFEMHVELAEVEFGKFPLECGGVHSKIGERADGHVAADTGDAIKKENFHSAVFDSKKP